MPGSSASWSQNLYMCASASTARVIKTHFTYDGTGGLSDLQVEKGMPQTPLWAIERTNEARDDAVWGVIDDRYEDAPELQAFRRDHLWLPAGLNNFSPSLHGPDTIVSSWGPNFILGSMYGGLYGFENGQYTGEGNQAILTKWAKYGYSTEGIAKMMNLIYVDKAAQLMAGSNSRLITKDGTAEVGLSEIEILEDDIDYNMLYKAHVFAFRLTFADEQGRVMLGIWLGAILLSFLLAKTESFHTVHQKLNQSNSSLSSC
jgi:hypothetical protein